MWYFCELPFLFYSVHTTFIASVIPPPLRFWTVQIKNGLLDYSRCSVFPVNSLCHSIDTFIDRKTSLGAVTTELC